MIRAAILAFAQIVVFAVFAIFYVPLLIIGAILNHFISSSIGDRK